MNILHSCIETRLAQLPVGLRDHIERARVVGRELAARHDVDADAIDVGIAAHDLARAMDDKALLDEAELLRIDVMPIERQAPILLHGPIAAVWLSRGCEPVDTRAIEAVRWHTTGHPDMDDVGKAVFLADKLDPQKVEALPYLTKVETLASCDMDSAIRSTWTARSSTSSVAASSFIRRASTCETRSLCVECESITLA